MNENIIAKEIVEEEKAIVTVRPGITDWASIWNIGSIKPWSKKPSAPQNMLPLSQR
jgi:lipopolysaccharide/colanic/teichoic acid biosynthesis glycosyltransferase